MGKGRLERLRELAGVSAAATSAMVAAAIVTAAVVTVGGCSIDGTTPPAVIRVVSLGSPGAPDFLPSAFPSDATWRTETGVRLPSWPRRARADGALLDLLESTLAARDGFCTTCNVYFPLDVPTPASRADGGPGFGKAIDESTLPRHLGDSDMGAEQAPSGMTASADDSVLLMDADPASPGLGALVPIAISYDAERQLLILRPARGHVLRQSRRYAAIVTNRVLDVSGRPVAADENFRRLRDGEGATAGIDLGADGFPLDEITAGNLRSAVAAASVLGVAPSEIVAMTVFTTDAVTDDVERLWQLDTEGPAPTARLERRYPNEDTDLDGLFGIPAQARPGSDIVAAEGTEGRLGMVHATVGHVLLGSFPATRITSGEGADLGVPLRDEAGNLLQSGTDAVPFALVIPDARPAGPVQVLITQHGLLGSRAQALALADTAGAAGVAVLAIDAFQHGARAATATDERNAIRDLPGADGLSEADDDDVLMRVFALRGAPDGLSMHPGAQLGTLLQMASDLMTTVRLVQEGGLDPLVAAIPELAAITFDRQRIHLHASSLGTLAARAVVVAGGGAVARVMWTVPPGSVAETIEESITFRPLADLLIHPRFGVGSLDEIRHKAVFEPWVDAMRWALESIDPLALSPYVLTAPIHDQPPPLLRCQLAGLDSIAAPPATESMVAATGLPMVGPATFAAIDGIDALEDGMVTSPSGPVGAGCHRFAVANHFMLTRSRETSSHTPPLVPPLMRRAMVIEFDNPTVEVHRQITDMLQTSTPPQ